MKKGTLYRPYMAATTLVYFLKERFVAFGNRLELHFCGLHEPFNSQGVLKTYIPLWLIHPQITFLSKVPAKGAFIGKAYFPLERRFFIWDSAKAVPNSYAIPWWPNQFCTFSVHFVRNVRVHFGLIWPPSNDLIWTSKSTWVARSDAAHWLGTKNVISPILYPTNHAGHTRQQNVGVIFTRISGRAHKNC